MTITADMLREWADWMDNHALPQPDFVIWVFEATYITNVAWRKSMSKTTQSTEFRDYLTNARMTIEALNEASSERPPAP